MHSWTDDLRSAYRSLFRRPGLTLAALVTLAVGIGANSMIFTVIEGVLIHPLPYRGGDRLVYMAVSYRQGEYTMSASPSYEMVEAWRGAASFDHIELYEHENVRLAGSGEVAEVNSLRVSPGIFPCLGVGPLHGRLFTGDEARRGAERVALLGYRLWRGRFGGDPEIVGRTLDVDGEPHTIVGVLPPHARFVDPQTEVGLWRPIDLEPEDPDQAAADVLGRLREGVELAAARAEIAGLSAPFDEATDAELVPRLRTPRDLFGDLERVLFLFQAAVGCVLLIACVNVAQLLLAQGEGRSRELALRTVLGAGRVRLVRQLLTESSTLGLLGGAGGLLLAMWGLETLLKLLPEEYEHLERLTLNPAVLVFTLALALLTGILFGLLPAFQAPSRHLAVTLREGSAQTGNSRRRLLSRHLLVASQVAVALVLLAGAGWLVRSLVQLQATDPGFDIENLVIARLELDPERSLSDEERNALVDTILEGLRGAGPAFETVTLADRMPPGAARVFMGEIEAEGSPVPAGETRTMSPEVAFVPGYFRDMGIPLLEGTEVVEVPDSERSAVISVGLAKRLWQGESALGRRFRFLPDGDWLRVAGVVGQVRHWGLLFDEEMTVVYTLFDLRPHSSPELAVRSAVDPEVLVPELKARLEALVPGLRIRKVATAEERLAGTIETERFTTLVMSLFAVAAALLTAVGIYGVVAYAVSRRTREIGIRMALGARGGSVAWLVVRRSLRPVAAGGVLGLAGSLAGAGLLERYVKHVEAGGFDVLVAVTLLVAGVSLLATWLPASRAAEVEPVVSLRCE